MAEERIGIPDLFQTHLGSSRSKAGITTALQVNMFQTLLGSRQSNRDNDCNQFGDLFQTLLGSSRPLPAELAADCIN